jgi:hypothetical protein
MLVTVLPVGAVTAEAGNKTVLVHCANEAL